MCRRQTHVLGGIYEVQDEPDGKWSPTLAVVGLDTRADQVHSPPPRLQLARSRSQNVLYPVALCSVGEGDDVAIVGAKGVDGGVVSAAGFSTEVVNDGESRQVSGYP